MEDAQAPRIQAHNPEQILHETSADCTTEAVVELEAAAAALAEQAGQAGPGDPGPVVDVAEYCDTWSGESNI